MVVWASLDRSKGRAAIKSFVVERSNPGLILERLDHKLGIKASDTATFRLENCRVPKENLLGSPEIDTKKSFAGAMQTFDNTRPLVAGMAVGVARACIEHPGAARRSRDRGGLRRARARAERGRRRAPRPRGGLRGGAPADPPGRVDGRQLPSRTRCRRPCAKAKAGRACVDIALRCVALCGSAGYGEDELLEKWARDAKILDIFEGTQQIQLLIIARQLLGGLQPSSDR